MENTLINLMKEDDLTKGAFRDLVLFINREIKGNELALTPEQDTQFSYSEITEFMDNYMMGIIRGNEVPRFIYTKILDDIFRGFISPKDHHQYESTLAHYNEIIQEQVERSYWNIFLKDDYIVMEFPFISMMFKQEDIEDYLLERWLKMRNIMQENLQLPELVFLKKARLGIRIESYAAISGGYRTFATLFTPEDMTRLIDKLFKYTKWQTDTF